MGATATSVPELIIFDCDGVLVDSETITAQVSMRVLADLGCSSHRRVRETHELTELIGHFDDRIFSADNVKRAKPGPDVAQGRADCGLREHGRSSATDREYVT